MDRTVLNGQLEIDHLRGVIYFHSKKLGCVIRICNLPTPIPQIGDRGLDITHLVGQDWQGHVNLRPGDLSTFRLDQVLVKQPEGHPIPCPILKS